MTFIKYILGCLRKRQCVDIAVLKGHLNDGWWGSDRLP